MLTVLLPAHAYKQVCVVIVLYLILNFISVRYTSTRGIYVQLIRMMNDDLVIPHVCRFSTLMLFSTGNCRKTCDDCRNYNNVFDISS